MSSSDYAHDAYVIQLKSLSEAGEGGYPSLGILFTEYPFLPERWVICDTREPYTFYFEVDGEEYPCIDYYFRAETKMSIEEAKKKLPQLFI